MNRFARITLFALCLAALGTVLFPANQRAGSASSPVSDEESDTCSLEAPFITWFPEEVECPVCKTKNIFMIWGSYGSYIYQDPSKYQLIFWPHTDTPSWYSCKKCRLTLFMEDFKNVPADKIADLRKVLETVKLPPQKELSDKDSREHPPYLEIPTSERIAASEKIYQALGFKDDKFWNQFYRVLAFHYDSHGKHAEADKARQQSIAITQRQLADKQNEGARKELLYLLGAMRHFTRDDTGALTAFEEADKLKFASSDMTAEQNNNYDAFLSTLIKQYLEMIKKGDGPRQKSQIGN